MIDRNGEPREETNPSNQVVKAAAARLLARGYHPVPLKASGDGKAPIGEAWGLVSPTLDRLNALYQENPDAGLGICLGPGKAPGGRWLIDVEADGPMAETSFLDLTGGEVVETFGWKSKRGSHRLFVVDDDFLDLMAAAGAVEGKGAKKGAYHLGSLPDLEIRCGGYKTDGTIKQVQSACPPTRGRVWNKIDRPAEFPAAAIAWLKSRAESIPRPEPAPRRESGQGDWYSLSAYVRGAVEREIANVETAVNGTRNTTLNTAAFNLGQLVGAGAIAEAEVCGWLAEAARRTGLGDDEARRTIRSGLDGGKLQPRELPPDVRPARPTPSRQARRVEPVQDDAAREIDARLAGLPRTDMGNGERLAARAAGRIRYCHPWNEWLVWDGRRYAPDKNGAAERLAKDAVRKVLAEAATIVDDDERKKHVGHAHVSQSRRAVSSMLSLAQSEDGVPILPQEMDRDGWLLNCLNGTLDLRNGELRAHDQADLLTKLCPVEFDPDAKCPLWDATLNLFFAGDQKLIAYWQRICGYSLVGVIRDHVMPVAYGEGSNGKSTILGAMLDVLGPDYAMKAMPDLLMAKAHDSHPTDKTDLFGKRLVVAIETAEGRRLDETTVKELTGGDSIRARRIRQDSWEFEPTHTLIMATNHKPTIRGTDNGIWRRLKLVPFTVKVVGDQVDTDMPAKLKAEAAGILAWAVRGCLAWKEVGLHEPDVVVEATAEYRTDQDVLGLFLSERTIQEAGVRTRCEDLRKAYNTWAEDAGERTISMTAFGNRMKERGVEKITSGGKWYVGVGLK